MHTGTELILSQASIDLKHALFHCILRGWIKGTSCAVLVIQHCYLGHTARLHALQMKNTISYKQYVLRNRAQSVWGLEAPYNIQLLYGPLDPNLCVCHSCPCFNNYYQNSTIEHFNCSCTLYPLITIYLGVW